MVLLVPQKKVPMHVWWEWSDIVYDQMGHVQQALDLCGCAEEKRFIEACRGDLKELWLKTRNIPDPDRYRVNFADSYRRILHELPDLSEKLQAHMEEDWRAGLDDEAAFKTDLGAKIFGFPSREAPRGIADGTPRFGYLPYVMRHLILGQTGFLYFGALKPRRGVAPSSGAPQGYDAAVRSAAKHRRVFAPKARLG